MSGALINVLTMNACSGVDLVLDVGVVDTTTCEPLSNAFVEIWAANSTGVYGGYSGQTSTVHVDTFLRGGYFTNDEGIVEITTIVSGLFIRNSRGIRCLL
jgi:protocatechuate 3,4-dioxygenase beta subunit